MTFKHECIYTPLINIIILPWLIGVQSYQYFWLINFNDSCFIFSKFDVKILFGHNLYMYMIIVKRSLKLRSMIMIKLLISTD